MFEGISTTELVQTAYLAVTALCFICSIRVEKQQRKFWQVFTLALALLALNAQIRLLPQTTQFLRDVASGLDWYYGRWIFQMPLVGGLFILGGFYIHYLWRNTLEILLRYRLMILALSLLLGMILIHTISFHITDKILYWKLAGMKMHSLLELAALIFIGGAAFPGIFERRGSVIEAKNSGVHS